MPHHAVGWLPAATKLPMSVALQLRDGLNRFVAGDAASASASSLLPSATLLLPQLNSFSFDELGDSEEKEIDAALEYHAALLAALGLDSKVGVKRQRDHILAQPNEFWLTVIAAGRKFQLGDVEAQFAGGLSHAGEVVGSLMRCADVATMKATHMVSSSQDAHLTALPARFASVAPVPLASAPTFPQFLFDPKLPTTGPSVAPPTADDTLFLDDTDMDIRRKIKRAFAAPNDPVNPVIDIAVYFISQGRPLQVQRGPENGGPKDYTAASALSSDYSSGALHPGDLKDAVCRLLLSWTEAARKLAASPDMKKLATVLRNVEKKKAKGKK